MSAGAPRPEELVEVRVPVQDRPGAVTDVLVLATELGINVYDLEIAHSVEGDRGVLVVVVDAASAPTLAGGLSGRGHRCSISPLGQGR
jgi:prephenate dehydrogenase